MAINIQVPYEIIDEGIASKTSLTNWVRSTFRLDTADFDGTVSYTFEIIAENAQAATKNVFIREVGTTNDYATITVGASVTVPTRYTATFTPPAGSNDFFIRTAASASAGQLQIYTARILINQVDATMTRIQIPMLNGLYNQTIQNDHDGEVDSTTSTSFTQNVATRYTVWKKDLTNMLDVSTAATAWDFETICDNTSGGGARVELWNATDSTQVGGTEVGFSSVTPFYSVVQISNTATNFHPLDYFTVRLKTDVALETAFIYKANLYVRLTNLQQAEVFYRLSRYMALTGGDQTNEYSRVMIDKSKFLLPRAFARSSGMYEASAGTQEIYIKDEGTSDTSTSGSQVSGSGLTTESGTVVTVGSPELSITSGNRYICFGDFTSGTLQITNLWLVVQTGSPSLLACLNGG